MRGGLDAGWTGRSRNATTSLRASTLASPEANTTPGDQGATLARTPSSLSKHRPRWARCGLGGHKGDVATDTTGSRTTSFVDAGRDQVGTETPIANLLTSAGAERHHVLMDQPQTSLKPPEASPGPR